jgi:hypothetical protein
VPAWNAAMKLFIERFFMLGVSSQISGVDFRYLLTRQGRSGQFDTQAKDRRGTAKDPNHE